MPIKSLNYLQRMAGNGHVELPEAVHHVLDRGDRQEPIVRSDQDRATFIGSSPAPIHRSVDGSWVQNLFDFAF